MARRLRKPINGILGHPVLKIKDVDEHGVFRGPFESFVDESYAENFSKKIIRAGDTLILNAAHNADYVGSKSFFACKSSEGALATGEWLIVRPDVKQIDARFAHYWLVNDKTRRQIREFVKGIHLYPKDIARLKIALPPLDEQRRIAAVLDTADALRRKRKRALKLLDNLNHSIFIERFGNPHQRWKNYPVVEVGTVTSCIVPGRDKPKSFTGHIPWITTAEVNHLASTGAVDSKFGLSPDEIDEVRAKVIPPASVLLTCVGDLGITSVAAVSMVINQQLHSFQCFDSITPEYLMFALSCQKEYMYKRATKTALPYMNKSVCNSIPISLPPIEEQKIFGRLIAQSTSIKSNMLMNLLKYESAFSSLKSRAFSGQL
jgi:type I restriction enzyme S subunit